jgi:hypothetical protein
MTQTESKSIVPDGGSWKRMMSARPVHNVAARVAEEDDGAVAVYVKTVQPWYMIPPVSWIVPHRPERKMVLDNLGSQVWRWCDGDRTVEGIIDAFAEKYALTFHEARVAVTDYVKSLVKRGALAVAMSEKHTG